MNYQMELPTWKKEKQADRKIGGWMMSFYWLERTGGILLKTELWKEMGDSTWMGFKLQSI